VKPFLTNFSPKIEHFEHVKSADGQASHDDTTQAIVFNLCRKSLSAETFQHVEKYCNTTGSYAYHVEDGKCTEFNSPNVKSASAESKPSVSKGITVPKNGGLSLTYSIADSVCKHTGDEKALTVTLMCDPKEMEMRYLDQRFYTSQCRMELRYASKGGCPVINSDSIQQFMEDNKLVLGMTLVGLGAVLAFAGYYFLNFVIFVCAFATITLMLSYTTLVLTDGAYGGEGNQPDWLLWTTFGVSLLVGGLLAWCITKPSCRKFGIGVLAGCGGVALGIVINQATGINSTVIQYAIIAVCAIGTCILVSFMERLLIIAITSFLGSYMLVRGVSLFAGGYPSEFAISALIKQGIMPWAEYKWFWAYLSAVCILSLMSACFQNQITSKKGQQSSNQEEAANHAIN
jgi:hypothetical protein